MAEKEQQETKPAEPVSAPASPIDEETAGKILKQIEFYFSDSNLPYDSFLFNLSCERLPKSSAPLGTGWVPLDVLISFKRMRVFGTLDREAVGEILKKSDFLKVSSDNSTVRRTTPLARKEDVLERTTYVKGFPNWPEDDSDRKQKENDLQPRLEAYFEKYGEAQAVRMRREVEFDEKKKKQINKRFKGSVYVEWKTKEIAENFLKLESLPKFEDMDEDPVKMSKFEYMTMKSKEKGLPLPTESKPSGEGSKRHHNNNKHSNNKPFNAFRLWDEYEQKRAAGTLHDLTRQKSGNKNTAAAPQYKILQYEGKPIKVNKEGQPLLEEGKKLCGPQGLLKSDRLLVFKNAGTTEANRFRALKEKLSEVHPPAFVDLNNESEQGVVSFQEPVSDEKLEEIKSKNIELSGKTITWERPDEETETNFHMSRIEYHGKRAYFAENNKSNKKRPRNNEPGGNRSKKSKRD